MARAGTTTMMMLDDARISTPLPRPTVAAHGATRGADRACATTTSPFFARPPRNPSLHPHSSTAPAIGIYRLPHLQDIAARVLLLPPSMTSPASREKEESDRETGSARLDDAHLTRRVLFKLDIRCAPPNHYLTMKFLSNPATAPPP